MIDESLSVWRLKIKSQDAQALALSFNAFWIPSNGELFIYNSDKSKILGAYTSRNNHSSGVFAHELIEGDELILEYVKKGKTNPILHIDQLMYAYRSIQVNHRPGILETRKIVMLTLIALPREIIGKMSKRRFAE